MRTGGPLQCRRPWPSPPKATYYSARSQTYGFSMYDDMDGPQHTGVTELDLSACHPNSIVDRINAMPGLKTSTAFFTFLRANLVLPHSAMSSNVSTPNLRATRPPSPSPPASTQAPVIDDLEDDDIPPLSLEVLTEKSDKIAALKLVADSIAQQRQQAASYAIFHPLSLAGLFAVLAGVYRYAHTQDIGTQLMFLGGTLMAYMLAIRYATSGYLRAAEALNWDWLLDPSSGEEDLIIGTRFGKEIIGATVLRLERPGRPSSSDASSHKRHKARGSLSSFKGGKGVIRAWTVRLRYRRRGVGGDMLREAVKITRERCGGRDAEVGFAKEHANSVMVLPEMFNKGFRRGEMRAARVLEGIVSEGRKR
ncbi:hypothetical protein QBC35DRAFT_485196 [Podospora australis]|uniref:Uncharacterized protein n=1 Tax=Podospora australis TaxID=1536484 RepID=A0AAN6X304_9PEZI|nr:hypothetical protein QBC35DRAFT_485196 [Podospora australis]